mgnify:FL=1|tara:strand:- start:6817 stop:7446 length:630 start_codon:yes stop_codon:yes gene_type:complete
MQVENIFGAPLYRAKVEKYKETLEAMTPLLNELFWQHDGLIPPWISTGWTRSTFPRYSHMNPIGRALHTVPQMSDMMDQLQTHLTEYWKLLGLNTKYTPYVDVMWAQRYIEGVGDNHNHPDHLISGGLYLLIKGEQTIYFDNPATQLYNSDLLNKFDREQLRKKIILEPGDIILWPGWINHEIIAKKPSIWDGGATRITIPFMVNGDLK